eukprot:754619-Hanusia_phi.AAC.6
MGDVPSGEKDAGSNSGGWGVMKVWVVEQIGVVGVLTSRTSEEPPSRVVTHRVDGGVNLSGLPTSSVLVIENGMEGGRRSEKRATVDKGDRRHKDHTSRCKHGFPVRREAQEVEDYTLGNLVVLSLKNYSALLV